MKSNFLDQKVCEKYGLVPDNHHDPKWYKVVIMDHVEIERLIPLIEDLRKTTHSEKHAAV